MEELSRLIVKSIRTEGNLVLEALAAGQPQDFATYSRMVGVLEGMRRAAEIVAESDQAWISDITGKRGDDE